MAGRRTRWARPRQPPGAPLLWQFLAQLTMINPHSSPAVEDLDTGSPEVSVGCVRNGTQRGAAAARSPAERYQRVDKYSDYSVFTFL